MNVLKLKEHTIKIHISLCISKNRPLSFLNMNRKNMQERLHHIMKIINTFPRNVW